MGWVAEAGVWCWWWQGRERAAARRGRRACSDSFAKRRPQQRQQGRGTPAPPARPARSPQCHLKRELSALAQQHGAEQQQAHDFDLAQNRGGHRAGALDHVRVDLRGWAGGGVGTHGEGCESRHGLWVHQRAHARVGTRARRRMRAQAWASRPMATGHGPQEAARGPPRSQRSRAHHIIQHRVEACGQHDGGNAPRAAGQVGPKRVALRRGRGRGRGGYGAPGQVRSDGQAGRQLAPPCTCRPLRAPSFSTSSSPHRPSRRARGRPGRRARCKR